MADDVLVKKALEYIYSRCPKVEQIDVQFNVLVDIYINGYNKAVSEINELNELREKKKPKISCE